MILPTPPAPPASPAALTAVWLAVGGGRGRAGIASLLLSPQKALLFPFLLLANDGRRLYAAAERSDVRAVPAMVRFVQLDPMDFSNSVRTNVVDTPRGCCAHFRAHVVDFESVVALELFGVHALQNHRVSVVGMEIGRASCRERV